MTENTSIADDSNSEADSLLQKEEFGAELKAAREAAGLSAEDIADSILISADIIRAIDNSRSSELPSATFTQGYIRSYSRILGISADKTIEAYNLSLPETKQIIAPTSVIPGKQVQGKGSHNSLYFIFAIIFIVGAFYWVYNNLLQNQVIDVFDKAVISENGAETYNETDTGTFQEPQQSDSNSEEQTYFAEPEILGDLDNSMIQQESMNQQQDTQETIISAEPVTSKMTLTITANEDSWCEVNDTESRLLYRLVKSGEVVEVQGQPPYRIFLGNARKVSIRLNQREIDFSALIRSTSKVVNLSLNEQAEVSRYTNN